MKKSRYEELSNDQLHLVNALCESFERAMRSEVSIECQLAAAPTDLRRFLFRELLAIEIGSRLARQEIPEPAAYTARFPEWTDDVQNVFAEFDESVLAVRQNASTTLDETGTIDSGDKTATLPESLRPRKTEGEIGSSIGPYRLLEQIGSGGMGAVYLAEQVVPVERRVALKLIKVGMDSEQVIARFEAERQALALMEHDNIARVLDAGTSDSGRPYFVMELVRGAPITDYCDENKLPLRKKLGLFVTVCRAVQHAHQKGIIHRDLKPSNVLVSSSDDHHVPKIIDFGIAKATGQQHAEGNTFTQLGQIVGTLEYMSPEQADLNQLDIDTRSDVYSLGVLLYQLLTHTTPISHQKLREFEFGEMLRMIRESVPPKPSTRVSDPERLTMPATGETRSEPVGLSRKLRGDLDWIVMKAIEKDRTRRYESASGLAADVERFLNDEPVEASPPSVRYRLRKFAQRNKKLLIAAGSVAVILIAATIVSGFLAAWATRAERLATTRLGEVAKERELAVRAAAAERAAKQKAETALYFSRIALAQQDWRAGNMARAMEHLRLCKPAAEQTDLRGWEWHYLNRLCHAELLAIDNVGFWAYSVAVSPDGDTIALGAGVPGVEEDPNRAAGALKLWSTASGTIINDLSHTVLGVRSVAFSSDGTQLVTGGGDLKNRRTPGQVRLWDAITGNELLQLPDHNATVYTVAFSPDGSLIASGAGIENFDREDIRGELRISDAASGETVHQMNAHRYGVRCVSFSPDGKQLASVGSDKQILIWDVVSGKQLRQLSGGVELLNGITFSPDGKLIVSSDTLGNIILWDALRGESVATLRGHDGAVWDVAFSPDGRRLASAGADQTLRVWMISTGQETVRYRGHTRGVRSVAFTPDGSRLVSCGEDETIRIWDLTRDPRGRVPFRHDQSSQYINALAFSTNNQLHASLLGGRIRSWDAQSGVLGSDFLTSGNTILRNFHDTQFTPDCSRLVGPSWWIRAADVWHTSTGRFQRELGNPSYFLASLGIGGNGKLVATVSREGRSRDTANFMQLWDINGTQLGSFEVPPGYHRALALNNAGDRIALAAADSTIRVYEATTSQELFKLTGHSGHVMAVTFSHDGRLIASAGFDDETVRVWDAQTGGQLQVIAAMPTLTHLTFSPDDERLAAVGFHGTVRIWSTNTWLDVFTLPGLAPQRPADFGYNARVAFSPNGLLIASSNWDGSVNVWDASPLEPAAPGKTVEAILQPATAFAWHLQEAFASFREKNAFALRFHLLRVRATEPPNAPLRAERGKLLAHVGLYEQAGADCILAAATLANDLDLWQLIASLQLFAGDTKGYERTRAHVQNTFHDTRSPLFAVEAARICRLAPGDQMTRQNQADNDPWGLKRVEQSGTSTNPRYAHILALSYYRSGQFDKSVEWIEGSMKAHPDWPGHAANWLILSMCHQQLERPDQAKNWLARAKTWIESKEEAAVTESTDWLTDASVPLADHSIRGAPLAIADWLATHALLHEAQRSPGDKPNHPPDR